MRARDLETLEFPRVLDAIAALARSAAGRQAVLELRPTSERAEAERRLDLLAELVALAAEAGRPPTADVPLLALALAGAAPDGATLEPRRLAEVRDLLAAARQLRAYLRRDPARFPRLAAEGEAIDPVPEVSQPLAAALDDTGQVRDDASPTLAAARAVTRGLRGEVTGPRRAHRAPTGAAERALAAADARDAAAQRAARHGCTRPVLGAPDVSLPAARHPLLLEAGRPVVAIDLRVPAERRGLT